MPFSKKFTKKRSGQTHYDCSRIINKSNLAELYSNYTRLTFSDYINQKIKNHQQDLHDGAYGNQENFHFGRRELAKILSCDYETIKKIINGSQKTRRRDLIIAICAALEMDTEETSIALILYEMLPLYPNNDRDLVIIQGLIDHSGFDGLNRELKDCGFNELFINRKKGERKKFNDSDYYFSPIKREFTVISRTVEPKIWLPTKSISDRFDIGSYDYDTRMILENSAGERILLISYDESSHEIYDLDENGKPNVIPKFSEFFHASDFESLSPELKFRFKELENLRDKKARELFYLLNDTRNYGLRVTASYNEGSLLFYGECFNQDRPELSEYYQLELYEGTVKYTLTHHSMFMFHFLGEEIYINSYGNLSNEIPKILPNNLDEKRSVVASNELCLQKRHFQIYKRLLDEFDKLMSDLKNKDIYIYDVRESFSPDEIIELFKVVQEFECVPSDEEPCYLVPQKDFILDENSDPVTIEDLYRAIELGLGSIHDISVVRKKHGSLEGILRY